MTETGERVATIIRDLGSPTDEAYANVADIGKAIKSQGYEESSKQLSVPSKPIYPPPWKIRVPELVV